MSPNLAVILLIIAWFIAGLTVGWNLPRGHLPRSPIVLPDGSTLTYVGPDDPFSRWRARRELRRMRAQHRRSFIDQQVPRQPDSTT